jgi:hypothetical protein
VHGCEMKTEISVTHGDLFLRERGSVEMNVASVIGKAVNVHKSTSRLLYAINELFDQY